ncbi:DUF934 domain-containing protein [Agitococcus lubricus]|uniref:Uncharacterized protein (DUF934 family) n=1 Tax=Agitococcus lubricus TaxID=1077255 RepID=A0A2T5IZT4_9GAMM|nr:DUF934 domain-containing protein [Agitococcus lubricus]PTQ89580.1 uncharacterized protein (DUF934 family) [Agitococcus lubricus]
MPNIIKDGVIIADSFVWLSEINELPAQAIVVTLALWQAHRELISAHPYAKAIVLKPDQHPEQIRDDLAHFAMIALDFPAFADGRGYSYAVLLRQRYGFTGELRATGDVFKDNLFYLKRCGFNSFAVRADKNIDVALAGLHDFTESYQASVDQDMPLYRRRLA